MTKERLKLKLFLLCNTDSKLVGIQLLIAATRCGLQKGKNLMELIHTDVQSDREEMKDPSTTFLKNFKRLWKLLTTQELLNLKRYDTSNQRKD